MNIADVRNELKSLADPERAKSSQWFFKTGKGEYGEGDKFIGITVPKQRMVAKKYRELSLPHIKKLLQSQIHEERLTALFIMVLQYKKGNEKIKEDIVRLFLEFIKRINNWDLVDSSAPYILGDWLLNKDRYVLYTMASSENMWERRIAIISTMAFLKNNDHKDTILLCEKLMKDKEDLIHKACGWMLREMGKGSKMKLENFLHKHAALMPRTMLRYAIEHFPADERKAWLQVRNK